MENKSNLFVKRNEFINIQSSLYNIELTKAKNGNYSEEYPKLRKLKPATLLKIQGHLKEADILKTKEDTNNLENLEVSLSQNFLKQVQFEKANDNEIKNEVWKSQGILLDDDIFSIESDEVQPLTLLTKPTLLQFNKDKKFKSSSKNYCSSNKEIPAKTLNYLEDLLVGIFYTKVRAHPNGFFAENLPHWYRRTFDKDPATDWFELIQVSNKFDIENVQNKIVLYAKNKDLDTNIAKNVADENAFKMEPNVKKVLTLQKKETDVHTESPIAFTRYKHLQKSLKECSKNAGRDNNNVSKNNEKHIKLNKKINKKLINKF